MAEWKSNKSFWKSSSYRGKRGLATKPPMELRQMGVDEKAVGHGQKYMTLVYNLEKRTVEWIGEDRKKETLDGFFQSLTLEQRTGIEDVGLDMWEPFIQSIREHIRDREDGLRPVPHHEAHQRGRGQGPQERKSRALEGGGPYAEGQQVGLMWD